MNPPVRSLTMVVSALFLAAVFSVLSGFAQPVPGKPIRLGIIGVDTPHAVVFTRILNDPKDPEHVPGAKVVVAFKGGSPDIESSQEVVDRYAKELKDKWEVEFVNDIPTLCKKVDAVLLESVDGRTHLEQVRAVLAARKPVFIDKPLATNYKDAKEIARLADEAGVPWFTSSGLRFWEETQRLKLAAKNDRIVGCNVHGSCPLDRTNPDLTWYGIHEVEMLFTLMGTGCESVIQVHTDGTDVVIGKWKNGRLGVMRGIRDGRQDWGITLFGEQLLLHSDPVPFSYRPLVVEIMKFFQTHVAPVKEVETLEIFAFMDAANLSWQRGGAEVLLSEVIK